MGSWFRTCGTVTSRASLHSNSGSRWGDVLRDSIGFQQQDAQELLAFLLDGLHEDLNRVKEKPYKELKDSDGRPDDEVSREAWDYHLSRNQSVIVDLFQGQLKSVVRCKVCNYKSVRFDPFTFLSLPLPMESTINIETVVVRLDGSQPVRYGLKLEVDDKYRALLATLSRLTGIKKSNLLLVEMFGATIRSFPPDSTKIRSQLGGWLYAFEIPDPPPPPSFRTTTTSVPLPSLQPPSLLACTSSSSSSSRPQHLGPASSTTTPDEERERGRIEEGGSGERGEVCDSGEERGAEVAGNPGSLHGKEEDKEGGGEEGREEGGGGKENGDGGLDAGREREEGDTGPPGRRLPSNSSIDGSDDTECGVGVEGIRPSLDRPLGSRDPTPPILLAPEDDDRLPAAVVVADDVEVGVEPESHDPGRGVDSSATSPLHSGDIHDGFIFAVHRKKFLMEQYFVASQKSRPVLFGTPLVVPCMPATPCRQVYELVWQSVRRLIIPDIPSSESKERRGYPFKLSLVGKDGLSCAVCPWHMFCRGCPIECNDAAIGDSSPYIAIDWDINILHLKYQSAQERPVEHESMESLKTMDLDPIDLYQCFKAFVREDDLGDEECWYCKQCKTHQEAVKSLEIWRLPPILIIHLKRFQFFNGRWVKSQRIVRFPTSNLDPLRFTAQNGNQKRAENGTETTISGTESREDQERPENGIETAASSKEDSRIENPLLSDTRPDIANTCTVMTQPLANGGRGHPTISKDPQPVAPVMEAMSQQDQLDKSLYNREGNVYNLVAITVSLISVTMLLNSTMYIMSLPPSLPPSCCAVSHGCSGRRSLHVVLQESQRKLVLLQRQLLQGDVGGEGPGRVPLPPVLRDERPGPLLQPVQSSEGGQEAGHWLHRGRQGIRGNHQTSQTEVLHSVVLLYAPAKPSAK
ncbi:Ubiquitin carboxyl-terminal hydrolase 32 [Geodia barretti]|uniref:ubiquitinyl hydrolase 1 n=1 Tax=Geodia barretti TaxID=519541 RepID=A0AA35TV69_GEOBA|nr:Ubiquitin carboxyl-terminal hydrolase 32 [Geodia barretti]